VPFRVHEFVFQLKFVVVFESAHAETIIKTDTLEDSGTQGPIHSRKPVVGRARVRQTAARAHGFAQKAENFGRGPGTRHKPWKTKRLSDAKAGKSRDQNRRRSQVNLTQRSSDDG
jgi:hypothetical protein